MKKKILIVDDDKDFKIVLIRYLSNFNFEIHTAEDGLDGIFKAAHSKKPDLIIMDVHMEQLDGIEAYRMIKKHPELREIPIIFVSAAYDLKQLCQGLKKDQEDIVFFAKPVILGDLVKKIDKILGINSFK